MARVASLGCMLCIVLGQGATPGQVHHIRTEQGTSERASHYLTICLCPECHLGNNGVHGDKTLLRIAKVTELDLLALTIAALSRRYIE